MLGGAASGASKLTEIGPNSIAEVHTSAAWPGVAYRVFLGIPLGSAA